MSENNSSKSPRNNTEVSPIRNLFRQNETANSVNADSTPKSPENKSDSENTAKKPNADKENTKKSDANKQTPTVKSKAETTTENKTEPKAEPKTDKKQAIKQETKPVQNPAKKSDEEKIENKNSDKEKSDEKTADLKSEKEPEPSEKTDAKSETETKKNSDSEKSETDKKSETNEEIETDEKTDKTEKKSFFGKIKSKINEIVMSMKQPDEETEPQIEDIFSSSGNFVREKNADPLDADAEYKENVIYTAPKEQEKQPDESVISVSDVVKAAEKTIKSDKPKDDKNDADITEILGAARVEKNTEKPKNDKSEIGEKPVTKAENTPKSQTETKTATAEKQQTVKSSEQTTVSAKPQQNNVQGKNVVQKPVMQGNQNSTVPQKSVPVKQPDNNKVIYQVNNSVKQGISEQKPQVKKPVDVQVSSNAVKEKPKTPVQNNAQTPQKAVFTPSAQNAKTPQNKTTEQPKPTQPQAKNTENISANQKSEERITPHSDNTAKNTNEKSNNDVLKKQNAVTAQKEPKTDVSDTADKKNVSKTAEQPTQKNNPSKIDGEEGIKILPWTPKKDVAPQQSNANSEKVNEPNTKGKDFAEGNTDILIYHYSKTEPFVVMAGKFTKTVKSEYEEVRKFNIAQRYKTMAEKEKNTSSPIAEKTVSKDSEKVKSNPTPKTSNIKISEVKPTDNAKKPSVSNQSNSTASTTQNKQSTIHAVNTENKAPHTPQSSVKSTAKISEVKKPVSSADNKFDTNADKKPIAQNTVKKSAEKKHKKPKKNYNFRNIFSGEEEYDPEEIEKIPEKKPQLDDYTSEKDSETIKTEIAENFRHVFTRTAILFVTTIISVIISIVAQCVPSLFNETIRNGWLVYAIISFLLFSVSVVVSRVPIVNGIMPLRHFKGNSDTAVAVASVAVAIQSIVALFSPDIFVNGTLYIYSALVILALFLNSLGKLYIITRTYNNFRFLSKPRPKYAGKIYTDIRNAEKISSGLPSRKPIIAYTKKSKFMSNFLQLSYAPDPSEDAAAKIAPYAALISLICGVLYGIMTLDFAGAVSSFALSACITIPICSLLAVNIPLKKLCHNSIKGGAMVTSYETVKQFCDTNVIMVDSSQLYPSGTVTLSGIKAFKESKINDAITAGAAIMFAVNGTMSYIFENIIQDRKEILPKVESVIYEDGMGLVGWINGQRVLIGNRRLLEAHNITPPDKAVEDKYLKMGNQVTYISMSGELIAMFILSYTADKEIMHELRNLEDNGVSFAVRTVDPNITAENIAEKFCLFHRCIKILPTSLGNICNSVTSSVDEKSRAYLVTRGKIASFARAVSGCIRIKSNVTLSIIIQYIAVILGILIVTLISFISGFAKLGCLEMLLYIGFWALATVIIPLIKK